jgi:hypothetical protein
MFDIHFLSLVLSNICASAINCRFDAGKPGRAFYRETTISEEKEFILLQPDKTVDHLPTSEPEAIPCPGLSADRQDYLYRQIRQYVADPWKDVMCPAPGTFFSVEASVADAMEKSDDDVPLSVVKTAKGRDCKAPDCGPNRKRGHGIRKK